MNVLVFTPNCPVPLEDGSAVHIYNVCDFLTKRGHDVYLAHFDQQSERDEQDAERIAQAIRKRVAIDHPDRYSNHVRRMNRVATAAGIVSRWKLAWSGLRRVRNEVERFAIRNDVDVLHVHSPKASALSMLQSDVAPKVLDLTDSFSLYYAREAAREEKLLDSLKNRVNSHFYRGLERTLLQHYDVTTVVSEADRNALRSIQSDARVEVVTNGVDTEYFSKRGEPSADEPTLVFHGTMDFSPNVRTARYIAESVFPKVRMQFPNSSLWLVGKNPAEAVKELDEQKGVHVTGYVDDVREYLERASVYLAPMQSGSGLKNKILEAMAMGKPVVTNSLGAEAFGETITTTLEIAEDPEALAAATLSLLDDEEERAQRGGLSRRAVVREHSWESVAASYADVYESLLTEQALRRPVSS
ncbi:glycosyltransferase family 4 protein [Haladaptatus sp. NG-SE-30]